MSRELSPYKARVVQVYKAPEDFSPTTKAKTVKVEN